MVFHGRIVCSTNRDLQALVREGTLPGGLLSIASPA